MAHLSPPVREVMVGQLNEAGYRIRGCERLHDAMADRLFITKIGKAAISLVGVPGLPDLFDDLDEGIRQHIAVQWTGLRDDDGRVWNQLVMV